MERIKQRPQYQEENEPSKIDIEDVLEGVYLRTAAVLLKIRDKIVAKEYGMVLGIDGSGRVPALLVAEVLKHIAPVDIRFVAGNRGNEVTFCRNKKLKKFISTEAFRTIGKNGKKVLIVDDTMCTGASIISITEALELSGIQYDIVALSGESYFRENLKSNVFFGSNGIAPIYGKKQMAGVEKDKNNIHASVLKKEKEIHTSDPPMQKIKKDESSLFFGFKSNRNKITLNQTEVLAYTRKHIHEIAKDIIKQLKL